MCSGARALLAPKIGSDAPEGCVLHSSRKFRICLCVCEGCPHLPFSCCERVLMGGMGHGHGLRHMRAK
eukprot:2072304-Alexandrium_andersonii.AAC.1